MGLSDLKEMDPDKSIDIETYERNRVVVRNYYQLDEVIFNSSEMVKKRIEDAEKLKKVMK